MAETYKAHLFICTAKKANGECCGAKGSEDLRAKVKSLAKNHPEWKGQVRVNTAGCLDRCEEGITAVLYPQGKWFTHLESNDEQVLLNAIDEALKGK